MINGPDGKKLSKRHGATAVGDYQHLGILPAAMRNFLALLGWSPGGDREIMTQDEMVQLFSFEGVQKKAAVFDLTKLYWMNGQYLSKLSAEELNREEQLTKRLIEILGYAPPEDQTIKVVGAVKTRSKTVLDVLNQTAARLDEKHVALDDKARQEIAKDEAGYRGALQAAIAGLRDVEWTPAALEQRLRALADERGVAAGQMFQPIRIALTGGTVSEPVNELLFVVGKDAALRRLEAAAR
jgi:glutamyl-tRNA synthetase